ncbi:bifunctional pyr operon transcriptional regulator/uracil phosphoribosyltransferase PyrR [Magnetofaba australis]|uniref:Putative phosphoribosyltransferase n=1 Tax=Magnetofaba australis IT-1 TaxID=1434232 RepID=A0A1Y2JZM9_9PROT|nr:bifunctional pyr operon transcriptional regulator/uracil phosphoribosyltransferase PyrR [Magnetofaba australis]OSM00306.1 putative phosphoribosyltransferase [Magnetofaba australis IT-1]
MKIIQENTLLTPDDTHRLIGQIADRLVADITRPDLRAVVGIRRGGALVAEALHARLQERLGVELPLGHLDISFYRDDLETIGPNPVVGGTDLQFDIDGKRIILVDDVLQSGRTIRAALNALFEFGRPEIVDLAVLVDRKQRQLPIQPTYRGLELETGEREVIKLIKTGEAAMSVAHRFMGDE